jgi:hypothetical protein
LKEASDIIRAMIRLFQQLSDRLLSQLVPKMAAEAGCITDPHYEYRECTYTCYTNSHGLTCCLFETCYVYSNCKTHCAGYCNVQHCW